VLIQLNLSVEEINMVLQVLGQTPTNSGVYPLLMNIKQQAESMVRTNQASQQPISVGGPKS